MDDCTFYYTNEYYATTASFNWRTRIGYFRFTGCTAPQEGTAHFVVTACSGGAPISNASVSIDGRPYGATLSNGTYDAVLTPGSHSYSVSKAGVGSSNGQLHHHQWSNDKRERLPGKQLQSDTNCDGSTSPHRPLRYPNSHSHCHGHTQQPQLQQPLRLQQLQRLPQLHYGYRYSHGYANTDSYGYSTPTLRLHRHTHANSDSYGDVHRQRHSHALRLTAQRHYDSDTGPNHAQLRAVQGAGETRGSLLERGDFEQCRHLP